MNSSDCKTKDDILLYMISNLKFVPGNVMVGDSMQVLGFRQSMQISQVWFNKNTKKSNSNKLYDLIKKLVIK